MKAALPGGRDPWAVQATPGQSAGAGAVLVLEDGRVFRGQRYGAVGETVGEAVFCTSMTGYQETLTDPSYHRQVVVMCAPHIGNTGVNDEDGESRRIWVSGYVVRDPARRASSWRARRGLADELADQGVVGISGIDTRALTRHLRERGAMRVGISSVSDDTDTLLDAVRAVPAMAGADLAGQVSTAEPYLVPAVGERQFTVAALDLGIKQMTPTMLAARGIDVRVLPADASLDDVLATGADGVFCSNGPGDPATANLDVLHGVLARGLPFLGICFGHQLFARALGLGTYKLRYGHRGINQPVLDRRTGRVEVTAHNHGFAVGWPGRENEHSAVSAPLDRPVDTPYGQVEVSHVCLNDDVVEGLRLTGHDGRLAAFSVQYHPEAAAGPHDAGHLFDRFVDMLQAAR